MKKEIKNIVRNLVENQILGEKIFQIDESNLNRLLGKHYTDGFVIVTSYRNEKTDEQNKKDFKELKNLAISNKFSFIPVYGGFVENKGQPDERVVQEPALLIPNHVVGTDKAYDKDSDLYNFGLEMTKKYNQDSFLYKPQGSDSTAYYVDQNGDKTYTFHNKTVNDLTQIYFTDLEKSFNKKEGDKTLKRFTFTEEVYLSESPQGFMEAVGRRGEQFFRV